MYMLSVAWRCVYKQVCLVNIYFLIIDVNIDETAITKKYMKSRQLVSEGSSTLAICGILYHKKNIIQNKFKQEAAYVSKYYLNNM